ncbi:MAG: hypothetical protein R6X16_10250, partial [Anaerolineae bacterium]
ITRELPIQARSARRGRHESPRAAEVVNLLEPKVVIPMRYRIADMDREMATVTRFLTEMEAKEAQAEEALKIVASQLGDETRVCVLAPKR